MYYNNDCLKRAVCSSCNKRVSRFYNMSLRLRSSVYGGVPEWPKGTDCKSAASSFGGSNPPSSTRKKGLCILQGPFFCEINSFGICEIYLRYSEKTTYGCCEMRCGAWDLFHFTWCVASNFTSAVALISHFASAAGLCQHGRYFAQCPCNFVEIRL